MKQLHIKLFQCGCDFKTQVHEEGETIFCMILLPLEQGELTLKHGRESPLFVLYNALIF